MIQNEMDFINWIDRQLSENIPAQIVEFNIELIGSNEFDPECEDWACNEDWIPKERKISVSSSLFGGSWEESQESIMAMAKKYLESGSKNISKLKAAKAFSIGFTDGNLCYVQ